MRNRILAIAPSVCGGPRALHINENGTYRLKWGVAGAVEVIGADAEDLAARAGVVLGEALAPEARWADSSRSWYGAR